VRGLLPTREMIRRFASGVAQEQVRKGWVTRFVNKHYDQLISCWASRIDYVCHQADSEAKYKLYFDLLHGKIEEYEVLPENTYNMDEKGFMIGVTGRSKWIFSRSYAAPSCSALATPTTVTIPTNHNHMHR
jgi:hypothetical protein